MVPLLQPHQIAALGGGDELLVHGTQPIHELGTGLLHRARGELAGHHGLHQEHVADVVTGHQGHGETAARGELEKALGPQRLQCLTRGGR